MRASPIAALTILASSLASSSSPPPPPVADAGAPHVLSTAVFAGGCFWGVEAVFEHVRGVSEVVSGFAGAELRPNDYVRPFRGTTGYAEAVKITYDSTKVSYRDLLNVFFTVAHDPTQVDKQGPDDGAEYRSVIFFEGDGQRRAALAYIDSLERTKRFTSPIATQLAPLRAFRIAPGEHQDFVAKNPLLPYVKAYDRPKLEHLQKALPALFRAK